MDIVPTAANPSAANTLPARGSFTDDILDKYELRELLMFSKPKPHDLVRIAALSAAYGVAHVKDKPALTEDLQPLLLHNIKVGDSIDRFIALVPPSLRFVTGSEAKVTLEAAKRLWRDYRMSETVIRNLGIEARRMADKPKVEMATIMKCAHFLLQIEFPSTPPTN